MIIQDMKGKLNRKDMCLCYNVEYYMGGGGSTPQEIIKDSSDIIKDSQELVSSLSSLFNKIEEDVNNVLTKFGDHTVIFMKREISLINTDKDPYAAIAGFVSKAVGEFKKNPVANVDFTKIDESVYKILVENQISRSVTILLSTFEAIASNIGSSSSLDYTSSFEIQYLEGSYYAVNIAFTYGINRVSWFSNKQVKCVGFKSAIISSNKAFKDLMTAIYLLGSIEVVKKYTNQIKSITDRMNKLEDQLIEETNKDKILELKESIDRCKDLIKCKRDSINELTNK